MPPNVSLLAAAFVSITVFFAKHAVGAPSILDTRQETNPNGVPAGWNFVGCYDDNSGFRTPATPNGAGNRTLKAQQLVNNTGMTPAMCIEFCSSFPFPYGFAGVELGQQCWCDGVIQLTANLTDNSECNIPCSGDNTLICGGTSRISVFTDGTPSPKIPTLAFRPEPKEDAAFIPAWQYAGCFSDSAANRTLVNLLSDVVGLNAHTCAAACEDAFPASSNLRGDESTLLFSGVEAGEECWCGPSISRTAQRLPDIACESMGCLGSNDQACGGEFVIAVYQFNPIQLQPCDGEVFFTPFQLNAVFVDEPSTSVPITMTSLIVHTNFGESGTDAGILSYCPSCPNPVTFELDGSSQWELRVFANPDTAINNLTVIHPGGTVNFVEVTDDDKVFVGYCSAASLIHKELFQLTAFGAHATPPSIGSTFNAPNPFISFALCSNLTAGGRLDIVYKPLTSLPGYNLTDCRDVMLEMDFNVTVTGDISFF